MTDLHILVLLYIVFFLELQQVFFYKLLKFTKIIKVFLMSKRILYLYNKCANEYFNNDFKKSLYLYIQTMTFKKRLYLYIQTVILLKEFTFTQIREERR